MGANRSTVTASSVNRGRWAEELAVRALVAHGCVVVERNYRCRFGELDIIARDGDTLVDLNCVDAEPGEIKMIDVLARFRTQPQPADQTHGPIRIIEARRRIADTGMWIGADIVGRGPDEFFIRHLQPKGAGLRQTVAGVSLHTEGDVVGSELVAALGRHLPQQ